jgi:hypothetical protein
LGDIGKYTIISRDEITVEITPPREWRVGSGRFAVVIAGDNLVLESRFKSDRVFLHRLTQANDEPARRFLQVPQEELVRQNQEEQRHQEMMNGRTGKNTATKK